MGFSHLVSCAAATGLVLMLARTSSAQLNPHVPGQWSMGPLPVACSLTFTEAVVGRIDATTLQLAWLNIVNRAAAEERARLVFYMNDGRMFEEYVTLAPGRNSLPLLPRFSGHPTTLFVFSVAIDLTTAQASAGLTHRLSTQPWHVFEIAELSPCRSTP